MGLKLYPWDSSCLSGLTLLSNFYNKANLLDLTNFIAFIHDGVGLQIVTKSITALPLKIVYDWS